MTLDSGNLRVVKRTAHRAIACAAFAALIVSTAIPATATTPATGSQPPGTGDGHVSTQMHPGTPAPHPRPRKADAAGKYLPYAPYRFFDTRGSRALGPHGTSTLTFRHSDIPSNATAVVFNLSAIKPSANTYVTAWPSGTSRPGTAAINPSAGATSNNQVVVPLGSTKENGKTVPAISFYNNAGKVHLVGDLEGFYATDTKGSSGYKPTGPKRVADTRSGSGPLGAGKETTLDLSDTVPEDATAATLNLTGMAHGRATYLTAYPDGHDRPEASALNLGTKATATNQVTVSLPTSKKLRVYNSAGSTDLVADLAGYYGGKQATATYQPVNPTRIADTRSSGGPLGAGKAREFGASKVPDGAVASTMNLSGIRPSANTYLTAYAGKKRPTASSLNLTRGQTASNVANVPLKDERFAVYNGHGSTNLTADLNGYFVKHSD